MKVMKNILAVIVSITYLFVLLIMGTMLVLSNFFSGDYYTKVLESVDFSEIKASDLGINNVEKDVTVEDVLVDAFKEVGISSNDAKKIVNSNKIKKVVGRIIGDTTTYLVDKEKIPTISVYEVESILAIDEVSSIVDEIGGNLTTEQITNELNKLIKEYVEKEIGNGR